MFRRNIYSSVHITLRYLWGDTERVTDPYKQLIVWGHNAVVWGQSVVVSGYDPVVWGKVYSFRNMIQSFGTQCTRLGT